MRLLKYQLVNDDPDINAELNFCSAECRKKVHDEAGGCYDFATEWAAEDFTCDECEKPASEIQDGEYGFRKDDIEED